MLQQNKQAVAENVFVREFVEADVEQLATLMRGLASFERYLDDFEVGCSDLIERGLSERPQFRALVAAQGAGKILGMAVYHIVPFTYDLTPEMILKELFVEENARGRGIGEALMDRLRKDAKVIGCKRIKWLVLHDNDRAKSFYSRMGGWKDAKWENWVMTLPASEGRHADQRGSLA